MQLIKVKFFIAAKRAEMANIEQMKKVIPLITREISFGQDVCELVFCKSGKLHRMCKCALCTVDDASCFLDIRLKTSVYEKHVSVKSTVADCDVTNCATTLQGINKHASSHREAVSDSQGVPRYTEKISKNLRLLTCVDRSTCPIHHTRIQ